MENTGKSNLELLQEAKDIIVKLTDRGVISDSLDGYIRIMNILNSAYEEEKQKQEDDYASDFASDLALDSAKEQGLL